MKSTIFACILLAICITNIHSSEEGKESATGTEIVISDLKTLKKIEIRKKSTATSTLLETPTVIHQGNNLYIKPKFIFGSPLTSYEQGGKSDNISVISKVPDEETNIVIGTPAIPQVVVPPVITPPAIEDYIWIPPPRIPTQPPVLIPNTFQNIPGLKVPNDDIPMPYPPTMIPIAPNPPQLTIVPVVQNPIHPVVIPKPPELPPIVLPKLPIEVLVKRPTEVNSTSPNSTSPNSTSPNSTSPNSTSPNSTSPNSTSPRPALPSIPDMFSAMYEKLTKLLNPPNREDSSTTLAPDENENEKDLTPDLVSPTLGVQGIIAERVVPNIVKNNEVKVIMNPIFPSPTIFYET